MRDLSAVFADLGCSNVRTYIQSGNVVFESVARADKAASEIATTIKQKFGLQVPVVLRSLEEMKRCIAGNPYIAMGKPDKTLHVMFLADQPSTETVAALDPKRSSPDEFQVVGREIYLHLPNGAGNSKLSNAYFDSRLATVSTARNWATVQAIVELMKV